MPGKATKQTKIDDYFLPLVDLHRQYRLAALDQALADFVRRSPRCTHCATDKEHFLRMWLRHCTDAEFDVFAEEGEFYTEWLSSASTPSGWLSSASPSRTPSAAVTR